jgi:hypothetical protein
VHLEGGMRVDRRDMEGKPHPVVLQQQSSALPIAIGRDYSAIGFVCIGQVSNYHG